MNTWFTSDYHLGHANIIEYCERPFKNIEHMNQSIIRNHNARVKSDDTVIFLGDFCFRNTSGGKDGEGQLNKAEYYINKLNGRFVFVKGNHDNNNSLRTNIHGVIINIANKSIYCIHDPEELIESRKIRAQFKFVFCGHVHNLWKFKKVGSTLFVNVSCDVWQYMPVTYNELMKEYNKWIK